MPTTHAMAVVTRVAIRGVIVVAIHAEPRHVTPLLKILATVAATLVIMGAIVARLFAATPMVA